MSEDGAWDEASGAPMDDVARDGVPYTFDDFVADFEREALDESLEPEGG